MGITYQGMASNWTQLSLGNLLWLYSLAESGMAALPLFHGHVARFLAGPSLGSHIMAGEGGKEGFGVFFTKGIERGYLSAPLLIQVLRLFALVDYDEMFAILFLFLLMILFERNNGGWRCQTSFHIQEQSEACARSTKATSVVLIDLVHSVLERWDAEVRFFYGGRAEFTQKLRKKSYNGCENDPLTSGESC